MEKWPMSEAMVTIGGQRVYPRGQARETAEYPARPDARNTEGRLLALTQMSPSGWASGGNEETLEAGLPFLGGLVAVILFAIVALLLFRRGR
jgi:hypothetical protein